MESDEWELGLPYLDLSFDECPDDPDLCLAIGGPNCTCQPPAAPMRQAYLAHLWIYAAISAFSIVGNLTFVIIIWRSRKLHTVTHLLMTNLGVANLGFVLLSTPIFASRYLLQTEWVLGSVVCKLSMSAVHLTATASFYAMALVAVDRWLAVFYSTKRLSKTASLLLTCGLWAVSLLVAAPYIYFANVDTAARVPNCKIACVACLQPLEVVTIVIQYIIPLLITIPAYFTLSFFLCFKKEIGSEERQRRAMAKKKKVVTILMSILAVFTLAWTPLLVITLLLIFKVYIPDFVTFIWTFILASLGVALTPVLYMLNDSFRSELFAVCKSCQRRQGIAQKAPYLDLPEATMPHSPATLSLHSPSSVLISRSRMSNIVTEQVSPQSRRHSHSGGSTAL